MSVLLDQLIYFQLLVIHNQHGSCNFDDSIDHRDPGWPEFIEHLEHRGLLNEEIFTNSSRKTIF